MVVVWAQTFPSIHMTTDYMVILYTHFKLSIVIVIVIDYQKLKIKISIWKFPQINNHESQFCTSPCSSCKQIKRLSISWLRFWADLVKKTSKNVHVIKVCYCLSYLLEIKLSCVVILIAGLILRHMCACLKQTCFPILFRSLPYCLSIAV